PRAPPLHSGGGRGGRPHRGKVEMAHVGVDIGGSGVKGALVDLATGELAGERVRLETPAPSTPDAVAEVLAEVVGQVGGEGPLGCTFPGIVQAGVVRS